MGVTVIVETFGVEPAFVAVKTGVFPAPLAPRPITVFEFVQVKVAPAGVLANAEAATLPPLQIIIFVIGVTIGVGLTVTTIIPLGPSQPAIVCET